MVKPNIGDLIPLVTEDEFNEHKADYVSHAGYGTASGTNAKTITLNPAPSGYKEGMTVAFKNVTQNTGAVTLNVNGKGAKPVLKSNGSALSSGNLKAGSIYTVRYNGSNFILQGEGGEYGTAQASDVLSGKTIGTEEGLVTGTMPNRGAINRTITTQGGQIIVPKGYHNGSGIVKALFANLVAGNIKKGVSIGGIEGSYDGPPIVFDMVGANPRVSKATIELGFRPKALMLAGVKEDPSGYIYSDGTYSSGATYNRTIDGYNSPRVTILSNGFYFEGSTATWYYLVIG